MAYEKLNEYTNLLAEEYQKKESNDILLAMCYYYETILKMTKFQGQRQHFKYVLFKINPSYFKGYFKKQKP